MSKLITNSFDKLPNQLIFYVEGNIEICGECGREFDLIDEDDAGEWFYGHDCEADKL